MPTYTWVTDRTSSVYTLGNPPIWWNTVGSPARVASCDSPNGPGDVLERTEIYASAWGSLEGNLPLHSQPSSLFNCSIVLQGEVFDAAGSGFPDPNTLGTSPAVITAALPPVALSYYETVAPARASVAWSTPGYVVSKGIRGPAKYGGVHPALRVGLWTDNCLDASLPGALNSSWTIYVRTLWRTP